MIKPTGQRSAFAFPVYLAGTVLLVLIIIVIFPEKEIIGAMLGATAAISIWALSHINDKFREEDRIQRIARTIWIEITMLSLTLVDEGKWWLETEGAIDKELQQVNSKDFEVKKTARRLSSHYNLVVLEQHINDISNFDWITVDSLIRVMALRAGMITTMKEYYENEDRIVQTGTLNRAEKVLSQRTNCSLMALTIMRLATELNHTARLIDRESILQREFVASLRPLDRIKYDNDLEVLKRWEQAIRQKIQERRLIDKMVRGGSANPAK
ncbi:MAG: hypothetical protein H9535_19310 [Ignavibacteria bacterium]|nr:hypothetical protein [Ignavibacteria bacterium]